MGRLISAIRSFLPALALYAVCLALTQPPYFGDTLFYAEDVLQFRSGHWSMRFNPLWEFGHVLWRPIGALLAPLALAWVPDSIAWTPTLKITVGLIILSQIFGALTVVLFYDLIREFVSSLWIRMILIGAFIWMNPFLAYSQAGVPYVAALFFLTLAVWLQFKYVPSTKLAVGISVALGMAVLLWFPFVLVVPAAALLGTFFYEGIFPQRKESWLHPVTVGVLTCLLVAAGIGAGGWLAGARSSADFLAWYEDAKHGWSQNRQWLRAVSGITRLFFELGNDGLYIKRFVLKDPYSPPLSLLDLFRFSLWKIAAGYVFLGGIVVLAAFSRRARPALIGLTLAAGPLLFFSLFLFEPGSPERFMPILPFLFLALAAGWDAAGRVAPILKASTLVVLCLIPIANAPLFMGGLSSELRTAADRLADYRQHAQSQDLLITVTFNDPLTRLIDRRPLHPANRPSQIPTYGVIEVAANTAPRWRERFADETFRQWKQNKQVWISKSLLRDRPEPYVNWVEGDSPSAHWRDFYEFMTRLSYDRETARSDGFVRLAPSPANRLLLQELLSAKN